MHIVVLTNQMLIGRFCDFGQGLNVPHTAKIGVSVGLREYVADSFQVQQMYHLDVQVNELGNHSQNRQNVALKKFLIDYALQLE